MGKTQTEKRLYFAYGSNLKHSQMKKRCPHSVIVDIAYAPSMKLIFTGYSFRWRGAPASITPLEGHKLWGAIYELDSQSEKILDKFENTKSRIYHHVLIDCFTKEGNLVHAYTYTRRKNTYKEKNPSKKYLSRIIEGAKECKIPKDYIRELEDKFVNIPS